MATPTSIAMIVLIMFFLVRIISPVQSTTPTTTTINVWPKPRLLSWDPPQQLGILSPSFTITSPYNHPHLSSAVARYLTLIKTPSSSSVSLFSATSAPSSIHSLHITIHILHAPLQHGVNESYTLHIPNDHSTANLTAQTPWGAMRGLETFCQLVWGRPLRVPVGVYVWDDPIFPHRGLLLDTSRNYYGVVDIMRTIYAMSANKMNVFHWHITDSQSFPLVLPSEPELAAKGSYGDDMQYSPCHKLACLLSVLSAQ